MPPTRREFLKSIGAVGAAAALPGCGSSTNPDPLAGPAEPPTQNPPPAPPDNPAPPPEPADPPTADFDFPMVTPQPFAHGVASGDPLADRVIIWTRITEQTPSAASIPVQWAVGTGFDDSGAAPTLTGIVASGTQNTTADVDYTTKVDVVGLQPATTYYYQFTALGSRSIVGRTRTAPDSAVDELRIAVVACSSYWSSFWSGYGHLADRNDLDLVVHCGDYIYEFVDQDEQVRARRDIEDINYVDYRDWLNLDECRRRYALYRSDANHLRAHQQHPWAITWDNHDISVNFGNELDDSSVDTSMGTTTLNDVCRAFYEWTPTRPPLADGSGNMLMVDDGSYPLSPSQQSRTAVPRVYRKLDYGPMLDVILVDTQLYLPREGRQDVVPPDSSHLDSGDSLFSRQQYEWLTGELLASAQAGKPWRLIANQTWFSPADIPNAVPGMNSPQLGISRWVDYTEERAALFQFLRGNNPDSLRVNGNIVVSGDTHGNFGADLIEDNTVLDNSYSSGPAVRSTRQGSTTLNAGAGFQRSSTGNAPAAVDAAATNVRGQSVGVEFAPTSMGRGGADELIANANPGSTRADQVQGARGVEQALIGGNKNVQFIEWVDHGYGIVHITSAQSLFEYWWQDKLTEGSPDVLGNQFVAFSQANAMAATGLPPRWPDQIDPVTLHGLTVTETAGSRAAVPAPEGDLNPR